MTIEIISKLKPKNGGAFPIAEDVDVQGGYQVRADITDRNSIPALNRKQGMLVFVRSDSTFYTLSGGILNANWAVASLGGAGGSADGEVTGNLNQLSVNSIHSSKFLSPPINPKGSTLRIVDGAFPTKVTYQTVLSGLEQNLFVYRIGNNDILKYNISDPNSSVSYVLPAGFASALDSTGVTHIVDVADICYNPDNSCLYVIGNCKDDNHSPSHYQSIAIIDQNGVLVKTLVTDTFVPSPSDFCSLSYDPIQHKMYFFSNRGDGTFYYVDALNVIHNATVSTSYGIWGGVVVNGSLWLTTRDSFYAIDPTIYTITSTRTLHSIAPSGFPSSRLIRVGDFVFGCIGNYVFRFNTLTADIFSQVITTLGTATSYDLTYVASQDTIWICGSDATIDYLSGATGLTPTLGTSFSLDPGTHAGIKYLPGLDAVASTAVVQKGEFVILSPSAGYSYATVSEVASTVKWGPFSYRESTYTSSHQRYLGIEEEFVRVTPGAPGFGVDLPYPAPSLPVGKSVIIKDVSGTAATNTIVVSGSIDGAFSYTIDSNYGAVKLVWNGTTWNVAGEVKASVSANLPFVIDLTAQSADYTLNLSEYKHDHISLVGPSPNTFSVIFPVLPGKTWTIDNKMTDLGIVSASDGTKLLHLPKYTKTTISVDATGTFIEYGVGCGGAIEYLINLPVTGPGATPASYDTDLLSLPTNFRLTRAEIRVKDAIAGGTAYVQLGTSSGGSQILTQQPLVNPTDIVGDLVSHLGTDMVAGRGYEAYYPSGTNVTFRYQIISPDNISAGSVNIYLAGFKV
jgi:hypothetical protein